MGTSLSPWSWELLEEKIELADIPMPKVGRCRLNLLKPVLKAHMVSALEARI